MIQAKHCSLVFQDCHFSDDQDLSFEAGPISAKQNLKEFGQNLTKKEKKEREEE